MAPIATEPCKRGTSRDRARAFGLGQLLAPAPRGGKGGIVDQVVAADDAPFRDHAHGDEVRALHRLVELAQGIGELRAHAEEGGHPDMRACLVRHGQEGERRPAEPRGALQDHVEDRRLVVARAADDLQDLAGRRLAGQPCLQLAELADVLDGDDGLRGEGLDQRDLLGRKRVDDKARERHHADRSPRKRQKRHSEQGARPGPLDDRQLAGVGIRQQVVQMNGGRGFDGAPRRGSPAHRNRMLGHEPVQLGIGRDARAKLEAVATQLPDHRVVGLAEPLRRRGDRFQYRLLVVARTADDP